VPPLPARLRGSGILAALLYGYVDDSLADRSQIGCTPSLVGLRRSRRIRLADQRHLLVPEHRSEIDVSTEQKMDGMPDSRPLPAGQTASNSTRFSCVGPLLQQN
jgi:hypothetical protein